MSNSSRGNGHYILVSVHFDQDKEFKTNEKTFLLQYQSGKCKGKKCILCIRCVGCNLHY